MKKTFLLLTLLSSIAFTSFAQKKDKSPSFEEPEGETFITQLTNGNTFMMEVTKKEGIRTMMFDSVRKKTAGKINSKLLGEKIGYYLSEGMFEINGDIAAFFQVAEDRTPVLVRLIVDGKTGKLKSEEKISSLDKMKAGAGYAVIFGGVGMPDFDIVKDPESDYYALIRFNTMATETKDRIEVLHYGPDHKVINKANYVDPNNNYKYTKYLNAYVRKDNYVVIATYAFNTDATGGDDARFYVSQLSKGRSSFKQQELPYKEFYKGVRCMFEYNKTKQLIHMALITNVSSKGDNIVYDYHFQNIDPSTLKVDKTYTPDFTQVNDYYHEKMENKKDFRGILNKTAVDRNGNMIFFFQEKTIYTSQQGTVKVYYGDVALLTVSPEGKTLNSAVFPANMLGSGGSFSMAMVATASSNYIFFNNSVDNMNLDETKSPKAVKVLGIMVPVKYTYTNNTVKKEYLFKEPKEKKGNPYCDFSVFHYNETTKKFVTMYIDPEKAKACLMWVGLN